MTDNVERLRELMAKTHREDWPHDQGRQLLGTAVAVLRQAATTKGGRAVLDGLLRRHSRGGSWPAPEEVVEAAIEMAQLAKAGQATEREAAGLADLARIIAAGKTGKGEGGDV